MVKYKEHESVSGNAEGTDYKLVMSIDNASRFNEITILIESSFLLYKITVFANSDGIEFIDYEGQIGAPEAGVFKYKRVIKNQTYDKINIYVKGADEPYNNLDYNIGYVAQYNSVIPR